MNHVSFDFALTEFEQATLEQLISYKCKDENDLTRLMSDQKNIDEAKRLTHKWAVIRKRL
jgi:hypothetical protein